MAIYLVANETNVGWLYFIAALSASVILTSAPHTILSLRGLSVRRGIGRGIGPGIGAGAGKSTTLANGRSNTPTMHTDALFEDDAVEIALTMESRQSATLITVTDHCPFEAPGREHKRFFFLSDPEKGNRATYQVICYKRGVYSYPLVELESRGLLGLFRVRKSVAVDATVTVYPKYFETPNRYHPGAKAELDAFRPRPGHIDEFYGTREYRSSDSPRHIHWRSTARVGVPIVKEFQEQTRPRIVIVMDTSLDFGEGKGSTLECSVKLAATIARYAFKTGHRLCIVAEGAPERDISWKDTLEFLARLKPIDRIPAGQLLQRRLSADIIVVLSPWTDNSSEAILRKSAAGAHGFVTVLFTGFPGQRPFEPLRFGDGLVECRYQDSLPDVASSLIQQLDLSIAYRRSSRP
ncbi:MAG: DUF58 domain-containing protein [Dehalococcoidia bacterium]|nr:DUF58 domain-containing protein [Dehalococcoidia bacterium]